MLIVVLAAGLLTQFFPCCAFAIRSFSKVSATPDTGCMVSFLTSLFRRIMCGSLFTQLQMNLFWLLLVCLFVLFLLFCFLF